MRDRSCGCGAGGTSGTGCAGTAGSRAGGAGGGSAAGSALASVACGAVPAGPLASGAPATGATASLDNGSAGGVSAGAAPSTGRVGALGAVGVGSSDGVFVGSDGVMVASVLGTAGRLRRPESRRSNGRAGSRARPGAPTGGQIVMLTGGFGRRQPLGSLSGNDECPGTVGVGFQPRSGVRC